MASFWLKGARAVIVILAILLVLVAIGGLIGWTWVTSTWVPAWLQAFGSLFALLAVSLPFFLLHEQSTRNARSSVLKSAEMACSLMSDVLERAFDSDASYSEWWVPQWHVLGEIMATCPVHSMERPEAIEPFVTIRELFGRMKAWDEGNKEPWPIEPYSDMHSYVGNLVMNATDNLNKLRQALSA